MRHFLDELWRGGFFASAQVRGALAAFVVLALGLLLARLAGGAVRRLVQGRGSAQQALIARRIAFYGILGMAAATALRQLGVDLSVLLGAAGVLTVAIGFASQTSASNLISGLFLLGERPFVIGDLIKVGGSTGEVVSIDLLSVKLRTLDNLSVRIPNETLLKSEVTNYTRYPIRRIDLKLAVDHRCDLELVRSALLEVASAEPLCFDEPRPQFIVRGFGDAGLDLQLSVWARRDSVVEVSNALQLQILRAFAVHGIAIALPQRIVAMGAAAVAGPVTPSA